MAGVDDMPIINKVTGLSSLEHALSKRFFNENIKIYSINYVSIKQRKISFVLDLNNCVEIKINSSPFFTNYVIDDISIDETDDFFGNWIYQSILKISLIDELLMQENDL